jgi:uncharacterized protein YegJ (DUF2314 family)
MQNQAEASSPAWVLTGPNIKITGILQNEPHYVKRLRAGSHVLIKPEEVFDYVYYKADGAKEGNETGRLMQQQAE